MLYFYIVECLDSTPAPWKQSQHPTREHCVCGHIVDSLTQSRAKALVSCAGISTCFIQVFDPGYLPYFVPPQFCRDLHLVRQDSQTLGKIEFRGRRMRGLLPALQKTISATCSVHSPTSLTVTVSFPSLIHL